MNYRHVNLVDLFPGAEKIFPSLMAIIQRPEAIDEYRSKCTEEAVVLLYELSHRLQVENLLRNLECNIVKVCDVWEILRLGYLYDSLFLEILGWERLREKPRRTSKRYPYAVNKVGRRIGVL